jgi:hypothetical protein
MKVTSRFLWSLLFVLVGSASILSACSNAQDIPHPLTNHSDCLSCHGLKTDNPYPEKHAKREYGNDKCTKCHKPASETQKPQSQP